MIHTMTQEHAIPSYFKGQGHSGQSKNLYTDHKSLLPCYIFIAFYTTFTNESCHFEKKKEEKQWSKDPGK